jgi:predicted nucleotidyltransferase
MDRDSIIATLKRHEDDLHRKGVAHAALFGSFARGEANRASDIDILIELDPNSALSVFDYVAVKDYIAGLFEAPVDVVNRQGLKAHVRSHALADVVDAF